MDLEHKKKGLRIVGGLAKPPSLCLLDFERFQFFFMSFGSSVFSVRWLVSIPARGPWIH
jgi:hypothetical protein